jgi:hypothetical protein
LIGSVAGAYAIVGGSVCRMHGGGAPQVRFAAQQRVEAERVRRRVYRNVERAFTLRERWEEARARWVAGVLGISPTDAEASTWNAFCTALLLADDDHLRQLRHLYGRAGRLM